jgi:hypothetical protein
VAAHNTRQLTFVKLRLEAFFRQHDTYIKLSEIWNSGGFDSVEEVPGIFDLQVRWKYVPDLHRIMKIFEIGRQVEIKCSLKPKTNGFPALVSDVQAMGVFPFRMKSLFSTGFSLDV